MASVRTWTDEFDELFTLPAGSGGQPGGANRYLPRSMGRDRDPRDPTKSLDGTHISCCQSRVYCTVPGR